MRTIFNTVVPFLPKKNCQDSEIRQARLSDLLLGHKFKSAVEAVRAETDPEKRKRLKEVLPCFMPSVSVTTSKAADGIEQHSGFLCVDIDRKDNLDVKNFDRLKEQIWRVPYVAYFGLSCSGEGYFALIPIAAPARHRDYFRALASDFKRCGLVIDRKCVNVNRLRFVSFDETPYISTAAQAYSYVMPTVEDPSHKTDRIFGRHVSDAATRQMFLDVVKELEAGKVDATGAYGQWFEILCSVASTFGEDGRELAHRISSQADCYDFQETDRQFDECLRHGGYNYSAGSFFFYARQGLSADVFKNITDDDI